MLVYQLLLIIVVGWLSLVFYMIWREPHRLEKWKYPDLASVSVVFVLSVISFIVSALLWEDANLFTKLFGDSNAITFYHLIITIPFIIVLGLDNNRNGSKMKKLTYIPSALTLFIPYCIQAIFGLTAIGLSFVALDIIFHSSNSITPLAIGGLWFMAIIFLFLAGLIFKPMFMTNLATKFRKKVI